MLLSTLQNKLTLSLNEELLTQNGRKNSIKLIFVLQLTEMSIKFDAKLVKLTRNRRNILTELALMFKLIDIQMVISRKVINDVSDGSYEKSKKFMKFLIKELQARDQWMKKIHVRESAPSRRLRKRFQKWIINDENLVKRNECLYVLDDAVVKEKLIKKHHDDSLSEHFETQKILNLIQRKYFWFVCAKQVKAYVQTCNVCQRIKVFKHKFYEKLSFLSVPEVSWKEIFMNFIIDLSSSKRKDVVYNATLVIVDKCTKIIKYLSMIIKIDAAKLTKLFFKKIVLRFDMSAGIVNDKDSLFINAFWSALCYHAKIKRRLSTAFHSQTNEQTKRQNQILKHYLRSYADAKQTKWANLLSLTEFAYNNFTHAFADASPFYLMYEYNSEIHYEVENNFIKEKVPSAKERVKRFHDIRN